MSWSLGVSEVAAADVAEELAEARKGQLAEQPKGKAAKQLDLAIEAAAKLAGEFAGHDGRVNVNLSGHTAQRPEEVSSVSVSLSGLAQPPETAEET